MSAEQVYVGDAAAALQRLLAERRFLAEQSLSLDGYERWGRGSDPGFEAFIESLGNIEGRKRALVEAFSAGVARLRKEDPAALAALVQAHQTLLRGLIEAADPEADSTRIFVAKEEIAGWQAVADGAADRVKQNCFYIRYDALAYQALFGFAPGWPIRE